MRTLHGHRAVAGAHRRAECRRAGAAVVNGDVAADDVFDLGPGDGEDDARIAQWLQAFEADPHHGHRHLPFRHGDEVGSVVLRCDRPMAWKPLQLWLESVLSLRGADVLRLKGLVQLQGESRLVVLQGVHHVLHPPVFLERHTAEGGGTRIVLITRGLSAAGLRCEFAANSPAKRG